MFLLHLPPHVEVRLDIRPHTDSLVRNGRGAFKTEVGTIVAISSHMFGVPWHQRHCNLRLFLPLDRSS
jgi:hypothetical protein